MSLGENDAGYLAWVQDVLDFWFQVLDPSDWFSGKPTVDRRIRQRFLSLHGQLAGSAGAEVSGARALLAAVIVLDQFSRNLFRGDARAYASDAVARRLAGQAIAAGYDGRMRREERYFLYLPFEHSEDPVDQVRAVDLISLLGCEEWTRYALAHKALIDRFGRFPHRNAALGRVSSAEEIAAMRQPLGAF